MRILCTNGIHTDGTGSTDELCKALAELGFETIDVNYPKTRWWAAGFPWVQDNRALYITNMHQPGDALCVHSWGGVLARRAMQQGAQFSHVFMFSPADSVKALYPSYGAEKIHIFHNPNDTIVKLGSWLPLHVFGRLGVKGHALTHLDNRIVNIESPYFKLFESRHGFYFKGDNLTKAVNYIVKELANA